ELNRSCRLVPHALPNRKLIHLHRTAEKRGDERYGKTWSIHTDDEMDRGAGKESYREWSSPCSKVANWGRLEACEPISDGIDSV
ncbi:hypothetical protein CRG98_032581, partial [Punica granatum]